MDSIIIYLLTMLLLAILFNLPILIIILKKEYLTIPIGIIVASLLGIILFVIQPLFWVALITFFFSSSILSKMKYTKKATVTVNFAKGSTKRDAWQVIANSIVPLIFALGYFITEIVPILNTNSNIIHNPMSPFFIGVFIAFAVHNSDTWATEIGILSRRTPRLVTNLKKSVVAGSSGGITLDGLAASILGSSLLAVLYFISLLLFFPDLLINNKIISIIILIILAGFIGALLDSIEGATIQGIYYCNYCNKETESNPHPRCGNETKLIRGNTNINNDFVNLSSAFLISFLVLLIISNIL